MIKSFWRKKNDQDFEKLKKDLLLAIEKIRFHLTALAATEAEDEVTEEPHFSRVSTQVPFLLYNGLFLSRFPTNASELLDRALTPFKNNKTPALICVGSLGEPENLESLLLQKSCQHIDTEYDLGIDVQSFKIPSFLFNKVHLREAVTSEEKQEWVRVFFENFELPEFAKPRFLKLTENKGSGAIRVRYLFGYREDQLVGTLALVQYGEVTGMYCVSIGRELRKENLGTMMMAAAYRWAQNDGTTRYLVGNSNQAAYKLYTKAPTIINLGQTKLYQMSDTSL